MSRINLQSGQAVTITPDMVGMTIAFEAAETQKGVMRKATLQEVRNGIGVGFVGAADLKVALGELG